MRSEPVDSSTPDLTPAAVPWPAPDAAHAISEALIDLRLALTMLDDIERLPRHRRYWVMWRVAQAEHTLAEYLDDVTRLPSDPYAGTSA